MGLMQKVQQVFLMSQLPLVICVKELPLTHRRDRTVGQCVEVACSGWGQRAHGPVETVYEDVPFTRALVRAALEREAPRCGRTLSTDGFSSPVIPSLMSRVNAILVPSGQRGDYEKESRCDLSS